MKGLISLTIIIFLTKVQATSVLIFQEELGDENDPNTAAKACQVDEDCSGVKCPPDQNYYCHSGECHCHAEDECDTQEDCTKCPSGSTPTCDNHHCN